MSCTGHISYGAMKLINTFFEELNDDITHVCS